MAADLSFAAAALVLVLFAAHFALRASLRLAHRLGWSDAMIGMTVVAVGTSLPEIITHVAGSVQILRDPSATNDISGLVIGTNVGSDVFQQNFLLPIVALFGAIAVDRDRLVTDVGGLIGGAALLLALGLDGVVGRWEGVVLVGAYMGFLLLQRHQDSLETPERDPSRSPAIDSVTVLMSFGLMAWAADMLVARSVSLAATLDMSASFFGILALGVATAFPELATTVLAFVRGNSRVGTGVLIGSNVTNPTLALGLGAAVSGYRVPAAVTNFDLPVKLVTAVIIFADLKDKRMSRPTALLLIAVYLAYLVVRMELYVSDF